MTPLAPGWTATARAASDVTALRLADPRVQVMHRLNGWLGASSSVVILVSSVVDGLGNEPSRSRASPIGIKDGDCLPLGPANDPSTVFTVYYREGQLRARSPSRCW